MLPLAAGAAVAIGSLAGSAMGQTWIGAGTAAANQNFSLNANWLGNSAPALGTVATPVSLTFFSGNAGAVTATNNLGTPWVANSLSFNSNNINGLTVAGTANNNQFELVGPNAALMSNGLSNATMANNAAAPTGAELLLGANVTFGGTGLGNLTLASGSSGTAIADTDGTHTITVSGGAPNRLMRQLVVAGGTNNFAGFVLDGGTLQQGSGAGIGAFGSTGSTMTVTGNGGTLVANGSSGSSLGTLQLNGDLHILGTSSVNLSNSTATAPAVLQGSGTLYVNTSGGGMQISSNSNGYTGAVVIDQSEFALGSASSAGTLTLNSLAFAGSPLMGSLTGVPSYDIRAGGTLVASNNGANSFQNGDRVSDTAPMRLRCGNFTLNGPAAANTAGNNYVPTALTEKIGDVTGAGTNNFTVSPASGVNLVTTLEIHSMARVDRGVFNFRSSVAGLGDGSTVNRGRVMLDTALPSTDFVGGGGAGGSKNISILTYGMGGTSTSDGGSGFVTYGAEGFRMLAASEYDLDPAGLVPGSPDNNVKLDVTVTNNATQTMNALQLGKGTSPNDGNVAGTGTLNITSGVVLASGANSAAGNPQMCTNNLAFGNAEAMIWTNNFAGLKITGQLTGSNGLTRAGLGASSGTNVVMLDADNSGLTGPLTLNGGRLQYNQNLALPGTGQIVANSGGTSTVGGNAAASLEWGGAGPGTMARDVAVNTGTMTFRINDAAVGSSQVSLGNFTIAGTISGTGNVNFQGQTVLTNPGDVYVTNTANTYTGTTRFGGGNVHIYADGSTGVGGAWDISGGLIFEGPVTNSRAINLESGTIDTKANDVTLNGPISSYSTWTNAAATGSSLIKNGTGTLTLTSLVNNFSGKVAIQAGTVLINGNLGASDSAANPVTTNPGATLGGSGTLYHNVQVFAKSPQQSAPYGGGTLSPGSSALVGTPGIMTIWGSLNMAAPITTPTATPPSTLMMDLNGPTAGTGYDQIRTFMQNPTSAAQVLLGGAETPTPTTQPAVLQLSLGYAPSPTDVFWLITNTNAYQANLGTANTTTGTFAGMPQGSTVFLGNFLGNPYYGTISYTGDFDSNNPAAAAGNDVVIYNISNVPAPGSVALLGIGGLLAARRKRRMA
jgi:autotransporter-associated beta strand protein